MIARIEVEWRLIWMNQIHLCLDSCVRQRRRVAAESNSYPRIGSEQMLQLVDYA